MTATLLGFAILLGLMIGSFLNVVIYRYPRGESVVYPASRCPSCGSGIKWYQNIPVLSWWALGGRCANCKGEISAQYMLVESWMGIISGLLYLLAGFSVFYGIGFTAIAIFLVKTLIDVA